MTYFFSQSYPDIRAKFKKLDRGPLPPQTEVLAATFKVFHSRDEKARCQKCQMLAQAMQGPNPQTKRGNQHPSNKGPSGPSFRCGKEGHWATFCPNPRPPTQPCPRCHLHGHWAINCPSSQLGARSDSRSSPDLIGLATDD
jgi:hypothetical protein